jgi:Tol biopolymer transport system component
VNEKRLRELLRDEPVEDAGARARSLDVVRAAYREREPAPRRRRGWAPIAAVAACLVVAVAVTLAAGAPGDAVARWVRTVLGVGHEDARPALVRLPGGGKLLAGSWVVSADGSRRRLEGYDGTSWSPHGMFVVAWRGGELSALEPGGAVRWSLARRQPVRVARWAPVDGYRIAYLSGGELRVVNGDGTGDRRHGPARARVAPAWRPDAAHVLAYVDARDRVTVVAVDSGRVLWRTRPAPGVRELAWSPDGRRLLVAQARRLDVLGRGGRLTARRTLPAGAVADDVAWAPRGRTLAFVRRFTAGRSEVVLTRARGRARVLFGGPGRFGTLAWSPSGRRLLVPWPDADQWLFLAPAGGRTTAVANIARQFGPRAGRPAFADAVEWCCPG